MLALGHTPTGDEQEQITQAVLTENKTMKSKVYTRHLNTATKRQYAKRYY